MRITLGSLGYVTTPIIIPTTFTYHVTALAPLIIPEQPKGEWFDALAKTPAVATPLETLNWLRTPDSPSLGKRTYDSDTGPASPVGYSVLPGPDGPIAGPMELSGSIGQDDPEDREAKKPQIQAVIMTEVYRRIRSLIAAEGDRRRSLGMPDWMMPEEYEARDNCADSLEEYWQPEDECHDMAWSHGNPWNPDDVPEELFMGNDSCLEDDTSEEYYTYDTDSTDHSSHSLYYTCDYDS